MGSQQDSLLIYTRNYKDEHLLIVQNLSSNECDMELPLLPKELLLANKSNWNSNKNTLKMQGKSFAWFSF
jgi:hypothetical protein